MHDLNMQWTSCSQKLHGNTRLQCNATNMFLLFSLHLFTVSCSEMIIVTSVGSNAKRNNDYHFKFHWQNHSRFMD